MDIPKEPITKIEIKQTTNKRFRLRQIQLDKKNADQMLNYLLDCELELTKQE